MATNVFSGARAVFKWNDKVVAFASGIEGQEEIMYEPVDVLDRLEVSEYVPVGYRVSFTCSVFRTVGGVKATGPISKSGPNAPPAGDTGSISKTNIGLFPRSSGTPSEILTNGYMSATITDSLTNTTLYRLQECKAQSLNWSISARGIVAQNLSFNAIRVSSEAEPV